MKCIFLTPIWKIDRLISLLVYTRKIKNNCYALKNFVCFCGKKLNLKVNLSSDWPKDFCKRITRLPCWSFHNKFLIRDTITICSNATNNSNFIKFWSSEHNHERICHGFNYSRGLWYINGRIPDTTILHTSTFHRLQP